MKGQITNTQQDLGRMIVLLNEAIASPNNALIKEEENDFLDVDVSSNVRSAYRAYVNSIKCYKLLSQEEEYSLGLRIKAGDLEAREELINHNLRLVISIAKRYSNSNVDILDLIQEGNIGLAHAVDKFDPTTGCRLSTYATWWIEQGVKRGLDSITRNVRIPIHIQEDIRKLKRAQAVLHSEGINNPTIEEISEEMGSDEYPTEKVSELLIFNMSEDSLDKTIGDKDESSMYEIIGDSGELSPVEYTEKKERESLLYEAIETLKPRDAEVLKMHFGIGNYDEEMSYSEIGKALGICKERVRQLIERGMKDIRAYMLRYSN